MKKTSPDRSRRQPASKTEVPVAVLLQVARSARRTITPNAHQPFCSRRQSRIEPRADRAPFLPLLHSYPHSRVVPNRPRRTRFIHFRSRTDSDPDFRPDQITRLPCLEAAFCASGQRYGHAPGAENGMKQSAGIASNPTPTQARLPLRTGSGLATRTGTRRYIFELIRERTRRTAGTTNR